MAESRKMLFERLFSEQRGALQAFFRRRPRCRLDATDLAQEVYLRMLRIADTLDMFTRLPVRICGEVQLWIHHNLLARCDRSDVTEVYSRPQALSQCRNWLTKHLPMARVIEVTSTSTAAPSPSSPAP